MSKFDEILNSSDASDALLGEQIDALAKNKLDSGGWNRISKSFTQTAANTLEYTGVSITVPDKKVALVTVLNQYNNSAPVKVSALCSASKSDSWREIASGAMMCSFVLIPEANAQTAYIWTSHAGATSNDIVVYYKFI